MLCSPVISWIPSEHLWKLECVKTAGVFHAIPKAQPLGLLAKDTRKMAQAKPHFVPGHWKPWRCQVSHTVAGGQISPLASLPVKRFVGFECQDLSVTVYLFHQVPADTTGFWIFSYECFSACSSLFHVLVL